MTQSYYRQSDCIIVVYDVSNLESFQTTEKWWREINRYSKKEVCRILVANKTDLEPMVQSQEGSERAQALGATYFFESR
jgi:small GTP-binding protein